jgi:hypothetical protein
MKKQLLGLIASAVIGGLASIGTAKADTYLTFNVVTGSSFADAELQYSAPYVVDPGPVPLGGTLYIDVTTGTVITADLTIAGYNFAAQSVTAPAFAPLNNIASQFTSVNSTGLLYGLSLSSLPGNLGDTGTLYFIVPGDQSNPLIGHPYIEIDQGEFTEPFGPGFDYIPFGLTGAIQATPLPSTWTMLIAGFVGLGFFAYRGTKKSAAALAA